MNEVQELTGTPATEGTPTVLNFSPAAKMGYIFSGVVLPTICFGFAATGFLSKEVDWQTDSFSDYCKLLFSLKSCLPFYPFLIYPMVCMSCLVARTERYSRHFVIRLGIYTGVMLATHYFVLLGLSTEGLVFFGPPLVALFLWGCAGLVVWLFTWINSDHRSDRPPVHLYFMGIIAGIVLILALIPPYCIFIVLACSTSWAMIAYSMMSWRLLRHRRRGAWQFSLAQLLGFVTWLAAYLSAWRLSVNLMLVEYAKLPATPPDSCYIATAAARGHCRFVGSQAVCMDDNHIVCINDQTRYLKAAELTLAATCPRVHRLARTIYNWAGPRAARLLTHPLAADTAYLALKPAEWAARTFFAVALPDAARLSRRFYR
ncbi:MAG: hypothetical protein JXM70_22570 [Pirellulales bacterium]|nr:hypothetical protein [Pirellulales bacterium]